MPPSLYSCSTEATGSVTTTILDDMAHKYGGVTSVSFVDAAAYFSDLDYFVPSELTLFFLFLVMLPSGFFFA